MRFYIFTLCAAVMLAGAELPVREVVLYKNGVGYFERSGEVAAGESASVAFKAAEMNDVLKSLTVRDQSGGKVAGLRYESAEPIEQRLSTFPFTMEDGKISMPFFLNQLKGAPVTVSFGGERLTGTILLARTVPVEKTGEREQLVLLLDSGEMRTLDLSASTALQFGDASLQAQLRDYLRVLAGGRSRDKRSLTIDSVDTGKRNLIASYLIPAPVWKSSYRLIFPETGEPLLEGWAIVDNATGEDWTKVSLALVSGRPVSFITNLYEPKNVQRATAELPEYAAINPTLYEGGVVGGVPGGLAGGVIGGIIGGNLAAAKAATAASRDAGPGASERRGNAGAEREQCPGEFDDTRVRRFVRISLFPSGDRTCRRIHDAAVSATEDRHA